jgi:hypothetical protein
LKKKWEEIVMVKVVIKIVKVKKNGLKEKQNYNNKKKEKEQLR